MDVQEEDSALEGGIGRAHDGRLPVEEVVTDRARAAVGRRILSKILQLLVDTLCRHGERRLRAAPGHSRGRGWAERGEGRGGGVAALAAWPCARARGSPGPPTCWGPSARRSQSAGPSCRPSHPSSALTIIDFLRATHLRQIRDQTHFYK
eukprot:4220761-Prymnesium_polylepis.1